MRISDWSSDVCSSDLLASEDPLMLQATAEKVLHEIRTLRGLGGATSSANLLRPELVIRPDFARAAELGVTAEAIGDAVRIATAGDYEVILPKLNLPERQIYIRTMLDPASRTDLDTIRQLRVASMHGPVPLANVASVTVEGGPAQIDRSEEHTSELQSLMRISYAVFCLKTKT